MLSRPEVVKCLRDYDKNVKYDDDHSLASRVRDNPKCCLFTGRPHDPYGIARIKSAVGYNEKHHNENLTNEQIFIIVDVLLDISYMTKKLHEYKSLAKTNDGFLDDPIDEVMWAIQNEGLKDPVFQKAWMTCFPNTGFLRDLKKTNFKELVTAKLGAENFDQLFQLKLAGTFDAEALAKYVETPAIARNRLR